MILGNLSHIESLWPCLPKPLQTALTYLKKTDFSKLEPGIHDVEGRDIFAIVQSYMTKPASEMRPESHQKYIDVQYVWKGNERIGVALDTGKNAVHEDRLAKDDVLFYKEMEGESTLDMQPGYFAIFFPCDIHRPGCQLKGPEEVSKVVMKVKIALL